MRQEDFEAQFLDYLEGRLSAEQRERFDSELATNSALRTSFEEYSKIVEAERQIAGEGHALHPNFSVKVMDRLSSPAEQGFFGRLSMYFSENRRLVYSSMATCATLVLVLVITNRPIPNKIQMGAEREMDALMEVSRSEPAAAPHSVVVPKAEISKDAADTKKQPEMYKQRSSELTTQKFDEVRRRLESQSAPVIPQELGRVAPGRDAEFDNSGAGAVVTMDNLAASSGAPPQRPQVTLGKLGAASEMMADSAPQVDMARGKRAVVRDGSNYMNLEAVPPAYRRSDPVIELKKNSAAGANQGSGIEGFNRPGGWMQSQAWEPAQPSNESYISVSENKRTLVQEEPVSTFSIDVDTASYANVRRIISAGQLPPADAVRVEEFINYFDYSYPVQYEKPFTLSYEIAPSPLEKEKFLLKLGVKARDAKPNEKGWNLVLLVDVSGSMTDSNKLPLLKRSLPVLVEHMRPQDRISIVTYAGNAGVALDSTNGTEKFRILNAISNLSSGGSTNGAGGIMAAYDIAQRNKIDGGVNRVILMTDGDFNVGVTSHDALIRLIEEKRRSGITLTAIGVGTGNLKDGMMEQLADKGNGNYFYLDSFKEARKVLQTDLVGNMEVVAKDVKLQIEFNPQQVAEYRLVGYDNRRLNKQDFNNDAIDAGEIGTGHTVTAIYEVVLANTEAAKRLQDDLRYQKAAEQKKVEVPEDKRAELGFLKIRYKQPDADRSNLLEYPIAASDVRKDAAQATDDFRFAAAVSYFGTLLRKSQFAGSYTYADIAKLAQDAKGSDLKGYRQEFIELVKDTQALSGGILIAEGRQGE